MQSAILTIKLDVKNVVNSLAAIKEKNNDDKAIVARWDLGWKCFG